MGDRWNHTTDLIRDAALSQLVTVGHSSLTMEAVARNAYVSIGSVYARHRDRQDLLRDVFESRVSPMLERLGAMEPSTETRTHAALTHEGTVLGLRALAELALASRNDDHLRPRIRAQAEALIRSLSPDTPPATQWLVAATVVGFHFLTSAGCSIPDVSTDLIRFIDAMSSPAPADSAPHAPDLPTIELPTSPLPKSSDEVSESLVRETTRALAEKGLAGANVREIAARSGVTTGAVYRRYSSKNDLVHEAVVHELSPSRYEWTADFVSAFLSGDDENAATVLATQINSLLLDNERALSTLEMIDAARVDASVRTTLVEQFHSAARTRSDMFAGLVDAGLLPPSTSTELMGWLIQTAPAGGRILVSLGVTPGPGDLNRGMHGVISALRAG